VLVLRTLGAPERRRLRGRRGRDVSVAEPEPVPTVRVTVVRPEPFAVATDAERWLEDLRSDRERAEDELRAATRVLNRALHAQRIAAADPHAADVNPERALVVRIGFGDGEAVADGRYRQAWELPRPGARRRIRSMEAPEERFAAVLSGRERAFACEELVLRARSDLNAGRTREAALVARVALEALLSELPEEAASLAEDRTGIASAANAALEGELPHQLSAILATSIERFEAILRRRRLIRKG
jgi:hypothetical protein